MNKTAVIGLLLALGGCASQSCDEPWSGSTCRAERLLQQNDLLQAKILVMVGDEDGHELAQALLERSARLDRHGETDLYQALLLIRREQPPAEVLRRLEKAAARRHPHAIALLYKIHHEPYLIEQPDSAKAAHYRAAYAELDVARSGYPSFGKALQLVDRLVAAPQALAGGEVPCSGECPEQGR